MQVRQVSVRLGYSLIGALMLASVWQSGAVAQDGHSQHQATTAENKERTSALVTVVRESTRRFQDPQVALNEGYVPTFGCVSGSSEGAMGVHFVNFSLVLDGGQLDPTHPELLLYEPLPNGGYRLTGADYLVLSQDWYAHNDAPPELMGQLFHLFEAPNRFKLPEFLTLHVWAWKDNPQGTFANWNPNVSCDAYNPQS
jgi:hypothetical protein